MATCPICGREFKSMGLRAHIWQVHEDGDPNIGYVAGTRTAWNKGKCRPPKPADEMLVNNICKPRNLRELLLEVGREYKCETCGQGAEHNGKSLTLHVDHIDGNNRNHERTNLRFLCPNCHSQTPTYGWKNTRRYKLRLENRKGQ